MFTFIPLVIAIAALAVFVALSLATLLDRPDGAAEPGPAQAPRVPTQLRSTPMSPKLSFRLISLMLLNLLLASALAVLVNPAHADGLPTGVVTTGRLNVRTGPGVSYTVVTRVDEGATLSLLARNQTATWVQVRTADGLEGWVNASYIRASVAIAELPLNGNLPAAAPATGTVTAAQLELRSGPSAQHSLVATLAQGQALTLLGRNSDTSWIKVKAGPLGEGWVPAAILVRLPGDENGTPIAPFSASVALSSLPVVSPTTPTVGAAKVSLSSSSTRPATPVYITVAGFPANRDIAAVLTSKAVPTGFVVATGRTDAAGNAQLFFRMPDMWPGGAAISESALSLAVGTTDGALLVWSGLSYRP